MSRHTYYTDPPLLPCKVTARFRVEIDALAAESYLRRAAVPLPPTAGPQDTAAAVLNNHAPKDLTACGLRSLNIYPGRAHGSFRLEAEIVDLAALATAATRRQDHSDWDLFADAALLVKELVLDSAFGPDTGITVRHWPDDANVVELPGFDHLKPPTDLESDSREVVVGWDPPLGTFFAQVFSNPNAEHPLLWLGTRPRQYETLDRLLQALPRGLHPDAELRAILAEDQQREGSLMDTGRPFDMTAVVAMPQQRRER